MQIRDLFDRESLVYKRAACNAPLQQCVHRNVCVLSRSTHDSTFFSEVEGQARSTVVTPTHITVCGEANFRPISSAIYVFKLSRYIKTNTVRIGESYETIVKDYVEKRGENN